MTFKRWSLVAGALILAVACSSDRRPAPDAADAQPVPVRVRTPNRIERRAFVSASGTVEAELSVEAAFQVPGRVARVLIEEGQAVRRGQLLAELDIADYRHALDAAEAQAKAAQAVEQKAAAGLRPQELEQARIDYDRWADEYKRMRFLYERKSLPASDFEKVEAAYNAARERYDMARQGTRPEDRRAARAQYDAAAAQAGEARKRLGDTRLLAPISGYVAMRHVDPGETVGAGVPVISVMDLDPVKVRAGIPEAEIGNVKQGSPATVSIPSLNNVEFQGKVEVVGVAADPASRTYSVKVVVPNPTHVLRAGMVAEVRVIGASVVNAVTLPGEAIVRDPQGATLVYVYFPDRGRVYARRVDVGGPLGSELEIRTGLNGGEQVVVAGQQNVREGSRVQIAGDVR